MICRLRVVRPPGIPVVARRWLSLAALERGLQRPVQAYLSTSRDPFLNLSIEHYLLQHAAPESVILLLYVNRPSIIIGRNQNPWLEVNLPLVRRSRSETTGIGAVDLVRRRSGGGTVFHDQGNVNWTVICPSDIFTRDKHAEMVVRALRGCGVDRARVNERHDIVLDQGERGSDLNPDDTHSTSYSLYEDFDRPRALKVSGSAYKLTRGRALHHGTCLLASPNLKAIPEFLHSKAKPFITARGVESVSSPVGNIGLSNDDFCAAVRTQFAETYQAERADGAEEVDETLLEIENLRKGYEELKSLDWTYLQTPLFTISNAHDTDAPLNLELTVRHGLFTAGSVSVRGGDGASTETKIDLGDHIEGQRLHELKTWGELLHPNMHLLPLEMQGYLTNWLNRQLPAC